MTTTTTKKSKLSVRKDTLFKKPSSSSLYESRAKTLLKKAFELSELCGIDVCIICYDREGNLVKTWPENNDEAQVKAMAERFSRLSAQERNKKSTNLSLFLNKKMMDEKKASLRANDNKFSKKVFVIEDSLVSQLTIFRGKIQRLLLQSGQDHGVVSTDLGSNSSLIDVDQYQPIESPAEFFYKYLDLLLDEQGMRSCNNFDLPISTIPPPMMHTQTSMFMQFDHQFMQTQQGFPYNQIQSSGYPTMMFS